MSNREKHFSPICEKLFVIGLIGDVAGGKSTVARRLSVKGLGWIDADRLAHRCLELPSVRTQLADRFGSEILDSNGFIDRRRLAELVFGADAASENRLQYLELLLHPLAQDLATRRMQRLTKQGVFGVVLDAPLLVEAGWDTLCDEVWCVRAPLLRRTQWAAARGWSKEELAAREQKQFPTALKQARSTVLLCNDYDRQSLLKQVDHLLQNRWPQS